MGPQSMIFHKNIPAMKTILLLLLTICFIPGIEAQINVGTERRTKLSAGDFEPAELLKLKNAKTLFIVRPADEKIKDQLKAILDEVWTFNEIELISREDLKDYANVSADQLAFLAVEGHSTTVQMKTTSYVVSHYYLHLSMQGKEIPYTEKELKKMKKRGEKAVKRYETNTFARIELYPNGELMIRADEFRHPFNLTDGKKDDHMEYVYNEAVFYNMEPGYLKNALHLVNQQLEAGESRWLFQHVNKDQALRKLRRATLYIPDYVLIRFNKFNGKEDKRHELEDLFEDYKYKHEVISMDDLNEKILTATEPFYYFSYIRSSTDGYLTIINGQSGEIVYNEYNPATYNLKPKNIKAVSKAIEKAN
jgi:hypothetical protein